MDLALRRRIGTTPLLALALLLVLVAPARARDVPRDFYGTVLDGGVVTAPAGVLAGQWPQMASSGVETARVVF